MNINMNSCYFHSEGSLLRSEARAVFSVEHSRTEVKGANSLGAPLMEAKWSFSAQISKIPGEAVDL